MKLTALRNGAVLPLDAGVGRVAPGSHLIVIGVAAEVVRAAVLWGENGLVRGLHVPSLAGDARLGVVARAVVPDARPVDALCSSGERKQIGFIKV